MTDPTTTVLADDLGFPEAPRWHGGRLWFSDFHDRVVRRMPAAGGPEVVLELDDSPSGLGWLPDGDLLVVSMVRRALLRVGERGTRVHADLSAATRFRANDLVVDTAGRAYVSSFGFDLESGAEPVATDLVRVDPDGSVSVAAPDVVFPNGMVLGPDGRTLVVAETYGARLTAFDVAADGSLSGRRVFAELPGVAPDGICLDAEGQVWVATARTPEVLRVRDGGEVTARVAVGSGSLSYACALGGDDGRTLFVCTAPSWRPGPRAGRIEAAQVEVPAA
ncbi:SMP-30/gluconolactonase/LRE family protein [Blastococcus sp. KM273128]|uniref:SMP-30/gluconolactonase/LRE family protein n=1 Tax=Blastococcus sp. KM273128 TaxID=2570314 RepID=UPI001F43AF1F|nr:SMP-30/gluconolactonase/LRE family protein [Blastococcus sp. KM273128]MCF6744469.1 SMP-30/gluconolactonase/LRE family protein [Blastococcus sp. KM273128]